MAKERKSLLCCRPCAVGHDRTWTEPSLLLCRRRKEDGPRPELYSWNRTSSGGSVRSWAAGGGRNGRHEPKEGPSQSAPFRLLPLAVLGSRKKGIPENEGHKADEGFDLIRFPSGAEPVEKRDGRRLKFILFTRPGQRVSLVACVKY